MRWNLLGFCLVAFLHQSCQSKSSDEGKKWIVIEDGACYMDSIRAEKDYEKGILVYTMFDYQLPENIDHAKLRKNLSHFQIDYKRLGENCTGDNNCYGKCMQVKIEQKFGQHFVDSLLTASVSLSTEK